MPDVTDFLNQFSDPRAENKVTYPLSSLLFMSICSGAETWGQIITPSGNLKITSLSKGKKESVRTRLKRISWDFWCPKHALYYLHRRLKPTYLSCLSIHSSTPLFVLLYRQAIKWTKNVHENALANTRSQQRGGLKGEGYKCLKKQQTNT